MQNVKSHLLKNMIESSTDSKENDKKKHEWLSARVSHESLNKSQKKLLKSISESYLTYTPTREALQGCVYDSAFITINSVTESGVVPVSHTRIHRKAGEPKYKSEPNYDAPVILIPDVVTGKEIIITEGFSKAVAACLVGYQAVCTPGVTMCQKRILDAVLADPNPFVSVIFDSSIENNEAVTKAASSLVKLLNANGKNAKTITWAVDNHKGLDDLLVAEGSRSLLRVLKDDGKIEKSTKLQSGCDISDLAQEFIDVFQPVVVEAGIQTNATDKAIEMSAFLAQCSRLSLNYTKLNKKGTLVPKVSASQMHLLKSKIKDLVRLEEVYNPNEDEIYFAEEVIPHFKTKVNYSPDLSEELDIILDHLSNSVSDVSLFRALCRKVISKPGEIERKSLSLFGFTGRPSTGKSLLVEIVCGLTGDQFSKIAVNELTDTTKLGHISWKRILYDDDLGGEPLSKLAVKSLLNIVQGTVNARKLYQASKEVDYAGTVILNSTGKITGESEVGLTRRLKLIKTTRSETIHAFNEIPRLALLENISQWALDMPDSDYKAALNTDAHVDNTSSSLVHIFLNEALDYDPNIITPIRELLSPFLLLTKYKMSMFAFEKEACAFFEALGTLTRTETNELGFKGKSRSPWPVPNCPSQVYRGGNYSKMVNL